MAPEDQAALEEIRYRYNHVHGATRDLQGVIKDWEDGELITADDFFNLFDGANNIHFALHAFQDMGTLLGIIERLKKET